MDFVRKQWLVIRNYMEGLPRDTKLLIVTLLLFLGLIGFVMMQYASSSEMVALRQVAVDRQDMVMTRLAATGISAEMRGGQIMVPQEKQVEALAVLAQDELLAPNTSAAFDQMIAKQSPFDTDRQNRQRFLIALHKVLGMTVSKMVGVRSADVMISTPDNNGFGNLHIRPSASINVVMQGTGRVNRRLVGAIAGLVSGAVAEMRPQDVVVIDANNGIQYTGKSQDDFGGDSDFMEITQAQEHRYREKIERTLSYIPGVIVAVNVLSDSKLTEKKEEFGYSESEPLRRERNLAEKTANAERAGETGARPNTGADINGGNGTTSTQERSESETEFGEKQLTVRSQKTFAGRTTQSINVTVNVPRPYFVSIFKQGKAADAEVKEPDDASLKPVVDEQLRMIESQVEPLIKAADVSVVKAHMIPDPRMILDVLGGNREAGNWATTVMNGWSGTGSLIAMVFLSVGIMIYMVRKASQQPQLPSIEELAGVPPTLPTDDEIVGEAMEEMGAMAGVEVDEDEIRSRQIADQISELVKGNPVEAANLVGRWLRTED